MLTLQNVFKPKRPETNSTVALPPFHTPFNTALNQLHENMKLYTSAVLKYLKFFQLNIIYIIFYTMTDAYTTYTRLLAIIK